MRTQLENRKRRFVEQFLSTDVSNLQKQVKLLSMITKLQILFRRHLNGLNVG